MEDTGIKISFSEIPEKETEKLFFSPMQWLIANTLGRIIKLS